MRCFSPPLLHTHARTRTHETPTITFSAFAKETHGHPILYCKVASWTHCRSHKNEGHISGGACTLPWSWQHVLTKTVLECSGSHASIGILLRSTLHKWGVNLDSAVPITHWVTSANVSFCFRQVQYFQLIKNLNVEINSRGQRVFSPHVNHMHTWLSMFSLYIYIYINLLQFSKRSFVICFFSEGLKCPSTSSSLIFGAFLNMWIEDTLHSLSCTPNIWLLDAWIAFPCIHFGYMTWRLNAKRCTGSL